MSRESSDPAGTGRGVRAWLWFLERGSREEREGLRSRFVHQYHGFLTTRPAKDHPSAGGPSIRPDGKGQSHRAVAKTAALLSEVYPAHFQMLNRDHLEHAVRFLWCQRGDLNS